MLLFAVRIIIMTVFIIYINMRGILDHSSSSCSMLTLTDIILIVRFYFFFYPQVVGNMDVHKKMVVDV